MFHQKEGVPGLKSGTEYVSEKIPPKTCCQAVIWSKLKAIFFLVLQTTYPSLWKNQYDLEYPKKWSNRHHQLFHPNPSWITPRIPGPTRECWFQPVVPRSVVSISIGSDRLGLSLKFWAHVLWENLTIFFWRRKNGNLKMGRSWNQSNLWSKGYYQAIYHILIYCTQFLRPGCSSQTKMCKFTPVQNNNHWSKQTLQCAK